MCEFVSFRTYRKRLKIVLGAGLTSHGDIDRINKVEQDTISECEWIADDKGETLTVRDTDKERAEKRKQEILKAYPKRIKLINELIEIQNKRGSGYLDLRGLTTAAGLQLPSSVGGWLDLRGLTTADGLQLPSSVGGYLDLRGLTTADGLQLPSSVGGYLDLSRLTSEQKDKIKKERPDLKIC